MFLRTIDFSAAVVFGLDCHMGIFNHLQIGYSSFLPLLTPIILNYKLCQISYERQSWFLQDYERLITHIPHKYEYIIEVPPPNTKEDNHCLSTVMHFTRKVFMWNNWAFAWIKVKSYPQLLKEKALWLPFCLKGIFSGSLNIIAVTNGFNFISFNLRASTNKRRI